MPRQRRGAATPARSAPTRPTVPAARPNPQTQQPSQPHSTAAHPAQHAPPQQASSGSGLLGQMASTAAGVAIGSSIGHAIGGLFSGGSSAPAAESQSQVPAQPMENGLYQANNGTSAWEAPAACENDVRAFRKCMDDNQGNLSICGWYLDQLKACQAAAKQY